MENQNQSGNPSPDLTNKEIERGLWFLRHKNQLIKIAKNLLIGLNVILFSLVIWSLVDYLFLSGPKERANLATQKENAIPYEQLQSVLTPQELVFGEVQVFGGRENKYDLAAELKNSNERVWAEFEYQFVGANFQTVKQKDFILPKSNKFLLQLGVVTPARPQNMRLVFTKFSWHRLSRQTLPDYDKFKNEHLMFQITGINFSRNALDRGVFNQVQFKIKNNSAYNFWAVPLNIALYRGTQFAAFNAVTLEKLRSLEERDVSVVWEEGLPQVTSVDVQPDVNIFEQNVYIP